MKKANDFWKKKTLERLPIKRLFPCGISIFQGSSTRLKLLKFSSITLLSLKRTKIQINISFQNEVKPRDFFWWLTPFLLNLHLFYSRNKNKLEDFFVKLLEPSNWTIFTLSKSNYLQISPQLKTIVKFQYYGEISRLQKVLKMTNLALFGRF